VTESIFKREGALEIENIFKREGALEIENMFSREKMHCADLSAQCKLMHLRVVFDKGGEDPWDALSHRSLSAN